MRRISRRDFVVGASAVAPSAAAADVVRIGYIADFNGASLAAIVTDQNLWTERSLQPDLRVFTNGPIQIQAFGSGSLDFGYVGLARFGCRPAAAPRSLRSTISGRPIASSPRLALAHSPT